MQKIRISGKTDLELVQGDITVQTTAGIVNAANAALVGGGGVDGAIHRAAGPSILEETKAKYPDGCPTGNAVITEAGNLPCRKIIHTVGPIWQGGHQGESDELARAYQSCLTIADHHELESLAFPAVSCGVYGYPIEEAAEVALRTIENWVTQNLEKEDLNPQLIRFVLFGNDTFQIFENAVATVFQASGDE